MELILEKQTLPEDNSKFSMQSHQTLKIADTKNNRRSFSNLRGNIIKELILLHPRAFASVTNSLSDDVEKENVSSFYIRFLQ